MRVGVIDRDRIGVDTPRGRTTVRRVRPYRARVVVGPETFRARLKRLRGTLGWSQRALAAVSGVPHATIGKIESGEARESTAHTVAMLAYGLGCSMDYLWRGDAS